jgi:DNA-binding MarR family transcriptional regulator
MNRNRALVLAALTTTKTPVSATVLAEMSMATALEEGWPDRAVREITPRLVAAWLRSLERDGLVEIAATEHDRRRRRETPLWRAHSDSARVQAMLGAHRDPPPVLPAVSPSQVEMDELLLDFSHDAAAALASIRSEIDKLVGKYKTRYTRAKAPQ